MRQETAVDGFRLAYDRTGAGRGAPAVLLLHGWPGDRTDYREVAPLLSAAPMWSCLTCGGSGSRTSTDADPARQYSAAAQARSMIGLIGELGLRPAVIAGYDIGSRIAQAIARDRPDLVRGLVVAPPLPGIGDRILGRGPSGSSGTRPSISSSCAPQLIDGRPGAVRAYLRHFWSHWSGPGYQLTEDHLDHLVSVYAPPGAFTASIAWYRAGAGSVATSLAEQVPARDRRIAAPTTVLWPEHDPLFPREWSDRIADFFAAATLAGLDGAGHFSPLEAPDSFAAAVTNAVAGQSGH